MIIPLAHSGTKPATQKKNIDWFYLIISYEDQIQNVADVFMTKTFRDYTCFFEHGELQQVLQSHYLKKFLSINSLVVSLSYI